MEAFAQKWFTMYYLSLGVVVLISGFVFMISFHRIKNYLLEEAKDDKPPTAIKNLLKYLFLFTIPCLIFSFIPFSWIELLFSIWSFFIVYIAGIQLVRWDETRIAISQNQEKLEWFIRFTGAIMVAVGLVILLLGYIVIKRINLF
jgi:heme/copper-type cytochrome/quinol oxidase subunit 2